MCDSCEGKVNERAAGEALRELNDRLPSACISWLHKATYNQLVSAMRHAILAYQAVVKEDARREARQEALAVQAGCKPLAPPLDDDVQEVLNDVLEYLDDRADADCDQDGYHPNRAMQLQTQINRLMGNEEGR